MKSYSQFKTQNMKKNLLLVLAVVAALAVSCTPVSAQGKKDSTISANPMLGGTLTADTFLINSSYIFNRSDTISVVAYCLTNPKNLKFKWLKLYGITGINEYVVDINGLMLYHSYLMPDRKTPVKFKVIYSVNND